MTAIQLTFNSNPKKHQKKSTEGLMLEDVKRNWTEAESSCASKGGNLASVSSPDDWEAVKYFVAMKGKGSTWLWLGGTKDVEGGDWTWSDGSEWSQENWSGGKFDWNPAKKCLLILNDGWFNGKCSFETFSIHLQPYR